MRGHPSSSATRPTRSRASIVGVFVASLVLSFAIWITGATDTLDYAYQDLQTELLQTEHPSNVVIVEIDARTLKDVGHWPLPRTHHATVLNNLIASGAKSIFMDIDFSAASTQQQDAALISAVEAASKEAQLILPAFWQRPSSDSPSLMLSQPLAQLRTHAKLGLVNLVPGDDGLVRSVSSFGELQSDVPPVWQLLNTGIDQQNTVELDYRLKPSSFRRVSYVDVLHGRMPLLDKDDIVFVGATALELGDIVAVPLHRALPGVTVQALAYESARQGKLKHASVFTTSMLLIGWVALCTLLLSGSRWRRSPVLAASIAGVSLMLVSASHAVLDLLVPLSPFVVATILTLTGSLLSSLSTESWRAWWALRRTREHDALLRQVVDHSSDGILTLDNDLRVRTANSKALEMLGWDSSKVMGAVIADLAPALAHALHSRHTDPFPLELARSGTADLTVEVTHARLQWDQNQIVTVTLRDVTAQRTRESELRHLALHDALTGLPNRVALNERLEQLLTSRGQNDIVALMMMDLDGFKEVNDTLGHSMGDELMRELGRRLQYLTAENRYIARVGGDEFALLWQVPHQDRIGELAQQLLLLVEEPILIKGIPVSLGTSIGIALCPEHAQDSESLLKRADIALYAAKRKHTRVEFYQPSEDTNSPRRLEMLTLLRAAVAKEELSLEYQPKMCMSSGAAIEVEALCRWHSANLGRVLPGEFIPLAEASDVIKPLTEWTIRRALLDCRAWRERGIELRVAVNLSARHLQDAQLPRWLQETLEHTGTRAEWLELEITESAIMTDPDRASRILRSVHDLGVKISIDDFGTGYSSLAYLRRLAVDRLKLDRSFISGMEGATKDQMIVESTIKLAHGLGLEVVAEGIETESQYELLREFGCDIGQGYWIGKPMALDALIGWYTERHATRSRYDELFPEARISASG